MNYYKTPVWIDTYRDNIRPVNGELYWNRTGKEPIGVPGFRKMPGRPKKKRIVPAHESPSKPNRTTRDGRTVTCSNCKEVGHNKGTCTKQSYVVEGPKRKRGRPRKIPVSIIISLNYLKIVMLSFVYFRKHFRLMVKATHLLHLKDKEKLSLKLPFQCLNPNQHHLLHRLLQLRFQHHLVHRLFQLRDVDVADHLDEVKVVLPYEDSHRSQGELVFTHVLLQIEYSM